jgi:hypothetical protein
MGHRRIAMQQDEMIATLARYKGELEGILSRFQKTPHGTHIDPKDDARFRTLALELRDLFDDEFVDGRRHSNPVAAFYYDSITNYIGSASYHGVESVKSVVDAALARRLIPLTQSHLYIVGAARGTGRRVCEDCLA